MRWLRLFPILLIVFLPLTLRAQLGLYGSFSAAKLDAQNSNNVLYGGTFGAYLASGRLALLSVGLDLRGSFERGGGTEFDSGSIGPRVALNPHVLPLEPYVEATVGVGRAVFAGSPDSVTKLEYQFLGGLDYTILPRIDWRVVEISYGGLSGLNNTTFHPKSISTGIVLRLPRVLPFP